MRWDTTDLTRKRITPYFVIARPSGGGYAPNLYVRDKCVLEVQVARATALVRTIS